MKLLAFDTETYLIQPTEKAPKPVCCTWADASTTWITDPGGLETAATFAQPDVFFVGQNIPYDLVLMMRWHPRLIPDIIRALDEGRVFDTAMRERMLYLRDEGARGYDMFPSLEKLAVKYLKLDLSKDKKGDDIWRLKYGTLDGVPFSDWPSEALRYALEDARHTFDVFHAQGGIQNLQPTEALQVQAAVVLNAIGVWGHKINQPKREAMKASLEGKASALHNKIDSFGWTGKGSQERLMTLVAQAWHYKHFQFLQTRATVTGVQIDLATWQKWVPATGNIRTFLQESIDAGVPIAGLIFPPTVDWRQWCKETITQLPDVPMTKKGVSIAGEVLEQLGDVVQEFAQYSDLRHLEKMIENYIEPYATDTVHPSFVPLVTTGRTGCRRPNTQNCPRRDKARPDEAFRTMFEARPGRQLGTVDYSQLELCTLAATIRAMNPRTACTLGDAIDKGMDVHCITGALISGMSYEQMLAGKKAKDEKVLHYRQGAKACFTGDTELLTPQGWRRIDQLHGDMLVDVLQYNPHDKSMEFVKPLAWVTKHDTVITLQTTHMDQAVTHDHRLLFISRCGVVREVLAGNMRNLELGGNNWSSVHGGFLTKHVTPISALCTRLSVMVQADGTFSGRRVRLGFTKDRKIKRCRMLLNEAHIPHSEDITKQGVTTFTADQGSWYLLTTEKTFVSDWTAYDREAFCDELFRWDGHVAKKHHTSYSSSIRGNTDVAQAILSTNGYKTCYHLEAGRGDNRQDQHKLEWYIGDRKKNITYHRFGECVVGDGIPQQVYCLAVPSSWVLTRRNGRVVVSGQCNFGLPGGLGGVAFVGYAKANYGLEIGLKQAWQYINGWKRAWPEVPAYYLKYSSDMVNASPTETFTAYTLTGRAKANCIYTEGSNYPFQGLAADGAKASLWAIWKEAMLGWAGVIDTPLRETRLVNFVHDEIVAEHPEGDLGKAALKRQEDLMVSEMTRICQNKITISVEGNLSGAWEH